MDSAPGPDDVAAHIADVRLTKQGTPTRVGLVLLEEAEGRRHLPIFVGAPEATALTLTLEREEMPRPMTDQVAAGLLGACGGPVAEIRITRLVAHTYLATVLLDTPAGPSMLDARPSAALDRAALSAAPIRVEPSILLGLGGAPMTGELLGRRAIVAEVRAERERIAELLSKGQDPSRRPAPEVSAETRAGPASRPEPSPWARPPYSASVANRTGNPLGPVDWPQRPMSSSHSSGRAAMKDPRSSVQVGSSSTTTSTPCSDSQPWPPVKLFDSPMTTAPIPNWRTSPLQYQQGESVVTITQSP